MKHTWLVMGMPVTVAIEDELQDEAVFEDVLNYFKSVDAKYSPYKKTSEVSRINAGLPEAEWSREMKDIIGRCQATKKQTNGYFDAYHGNKLDPSGLVKGWAVSNAAKLLKKCGVKNFYVDAGGDVQVCGHNHQNQPWQIGIRNPFNREEIIKAVQTDSAGIATSGTYVRGQHIYNPLNNYAKADQVASLTVIGADIYDADRFATAAFAMGLSGIDFIESLDGFEGYMVMPNEKAVLTSGFELYVAREAA